MKPNPQVLIQCAVGSKGVQIFIREIELGSPFGYKAQTEPPGDPSISGLFLVYTQDDFDEWNEARAKVLRAAIETYLTSHQDKVIRVLCEECLGPPDILLRITFCNSKEPWSVETAPQWRILAEIWVSPTAEGIRKIAALPQ